MNGASLMEIADILGHKTLAMVKRYAHLSEAHARNVVERMNRAVFGECNRATMEQCQSRTGNVVAQVLEDRPWMR
jgi:hypothetical protein